MAPPERRPLTDEELAALAERLPAWRVEGAGAAARLERELEFPDFVRAFSFMTAVALEAQRLDHHPDWSNSYRRVHVSLSTHDLGGLSTLDVALAERIDALA